jgi:integrase
VIAPDEGKTEARIVFDIPAMLMPYLTAYVDLVRPHLYVGPPNDMLWASRKGTSLTYGAIGPVMSRHAGRRLNMHLTLHDARDAAATTWAVAAPERILVARDLLGHTQMKTGHRHYIRARGIEASRSCAQVIAKLRGRKRR